MQELSSKEGKWLSLKHSIRRGGQKRLLEGNDVFLERERMIKNNSGKKCQEKGIECGNAWKKECARKIWCG